jgi:hypothetical protein
MRVATIDIRSAIVTLALAALAGACRQSAEPPPDRAKPAAQSAEAIPEGPVSGYIRNKPFAVQRAVYMIDRRPGYEHTDIKLYSTSIHDPCATVPADEGPTVWIRYSGAGALEPTTIRLDQDDAGPWEVNYQIREGLRWAGNGDTAALLVLRAKAKDGRIGGELSASFADAWSSRVSGSFTATECAVSIDAPVRGIAAQERPAPMPGR